MPRAPRPDIYRLNLVALRTNNTVPQADKNSLNNWLTSNVDPGGGDWLSVELSASGSRPYTHMGCSGVVSEWAFRKVSRRLLSLANVSPPAEYDDYNRRQKRAWLLSQAAAIKAATGVAFNLADRMDDPDVGFDALLTAEGLKRI